MNPAEREAAIARLRQLFRTFGTVQCQDRSRVYQTLSEGLAGNDALLALPLEAPADQRRPSLLFAAVNLLLASHPEEGLAAYYPIHGGRRGVDAALLPAFSSFCVRHRDALLSLLRERSTQTNEIRRCVALRLGLDAISRKWRGPFALVEVGASAGLNLLFDRYACRFDGTVSGASPVVISCEIRGSDGMSFGAAPVITARLGIDQCPVDLSDPDSRAWLEAFIWPEQVDDLAMLRGAIALASAEPSLRVVKGDAVADTARILGGVPGEEPVVVFTASLMSYLTAGARRAFLAQLDEAARRRPVAWIFAESPGLLATMGLNLAALSGPLSLRNTLYAVGCSLRGKSDDMLLALAEPYLRWLAPARGAEDDFQWLSDAS